MRRPTDYFLKNSGKRDYLNLELNVISSQDYGFSSGHVWM